MKLKNISIDNKGEKGEKLLLRLNIKKHTVEFYESIDIDDIYLLSNYFGIFDPEFITPVLPKLLNSNNLDESLKILKDFWHLKELKLIDKLKKIKFENNIFEYPLKSEASGELGTLIFYSVTPEFVLNFLSISNSITSILEGVIIQKRISIILSDTIDALSEALAKRRNKNQEKNKKIEKNIISLGKKFGFNMDLLKLCAKIYDIGMIGIPDQQEDSGEKHIKYGYEILSKIEDIPKELLDAVLFHHEKLDGSGPLKVKDVPLIAQIIGIVIEVFENNVSIESLSGKYDPRLLKELKHG
ncbi:MULTISPECIES: HD domain-containing protein [unclassified Thermosipho (in: thermotogales)]|uniref:HD-GYP domain-containing protein n=1 Tax=unclassified Thermosipho (in: thermotogales) TaxID=2676525 RepID=UPI0009841905|nr:MULTISPECIES: HD domain-containing protein [unclassified Thermosipho (in: thermotogales)]MBT1247212.1 phosphohydrolase [Thermosipho sp. 1244]OOC47217.1 phosphohydrolase [Thermosipho sp. 1223]